MPPAGWRKHKDGKQAQAQAQAQAQSGLSGSSGASAGGTAAGSAAAAAVTAAAGQVGAGAAAAADAVDEEDRDGGIESFELPKAVVARLAKAAGPDNMKLAKDVHSGLTKASTIFINYLAATAHDIATERNDKILGANHIIDACKQLGWDDTDELVRVLKSELESFRRGNVQKKAQAKDSKEKVSAAVRMAARKSAAAGGTPSEAEAAAPLGEGEGEGDVDETEEDDAAGRMGEEVDEEEETPDDAANDAARQAGSGGTEHISAKPADAMEVDEE